MQHIMLDLETWGTTAGSALRSIGACVFDPTSGAIGEKFYANITDASCEDVGLTRDKLTEAWWAERSAEAQGAFAKDPLHIVDALAAFNAWWTAQNSQWVWGHGANFDPVLLEAAYEACMMKAPWKFWDVRCCRTVLALANRKPMRSGGVHHNALDDAIAQAKAVAAAFRTKQFSPR